ncbi:7346_t:CDS:1, partial [Ambispora leptoticha]
LYLLESYFIGDKVLHYRSSLEGTHKNKLEEKWEGPFIIYDVLGKGTYKLRTLDNKVLKQKVHGNRLKRYTPRAEDSDIVPCDLAGAR